MGAGGWSFKRSLRGERLQRYSGQGRTLRKSSFRIADSEFQVPNSRSEFRFPNPESGIPDFSLFTMLVPTLIAIHDVTIDIGGIPILVRTDSADFEHMIEDRYGEFVNADAPHAVMELEIELMKEPGFVVRDSGLGMGEEDDLSVRREAGRWVIERGSYRAEWDPQSNRGWVRQSANPYAIDGVLRILHSLILAREGGFLVHAASAVRNGRAFVFAGVSGTGKTTLARLAPPDVVLLTDEISYVRGFRIQDSGFRGPKSEVRSQKSEVRTEDEHSCGGLAERQSLSDPRGGTAQRLVTPGTGHLAPDTGRLTPAFEAFGTPFAGELARIGQKVQAPLATLFLLEQGSENRIEPLGDAEAVRELLRHVLFFAQDEELVQMIFQTICDFVRRVPVRRLVFTPDARVWELIV